MGSTVKDMKNERRKKKESDREGQEEKGGGEMSIDRKRGIAML